MEETAQRQSGDFLQELGYLGFTMRIKRLSDKLMHDGRKLYQELGLDIEPNWYGVFLLLEQRGPLGIGELAEGLDLSHPSAIAIVNKMEAAGYLVSVKDEMDQRKRHLKLTASARAHLSTYKRVWNSGSEAVRQLLLTTNLFSDLRILETHLDQGGFRSRTIGAYEAHQPAPEQTEIVPYDDRYAADFARINYEWLHMYFRVEPHDREMLDAPKAYIVEPGGQIFFALVDGTVAGTAALIKQGPVLVELSKMGVSPMYKGRGIGVQLMEHALKEAKQMGFKKVYLESNSTLVPALNLYRKFGFVEVPLDPDTPYVRSDTKMERDL